MRLKPMKASVIVPCYNEGENIQRLKPWLRWLKSKGFEVIIVDDGSRNSTRELLKAMEESFKVLYHKENMGKAQAIATGVKASHGEVVSILDADLEYDPGEIPMLCEKLASVPPKVAAVYGSRFLGKPYKMGLLHLIGNMILSAVTSMIYVTKITDVMTGHKVIRKQVFNELKLEGKGFLFEVEVTAKMLNRGYRIIEVPIIYRRRKAGRAKIRMVDGLKCLTWLLREGVRKVKAQVEGR